MKPSTWILDAMLQPIESILPTEPKVSLLTSAMPFPENERPFDKWRSGVRGRNLGGLTATSEKAICPDPADRPAPTSPGFHEFYPMVTRLPHGCDGFIDDPDRWLTEADAALRSRIAYQMARELWTGAATGSQSLQSTATVTTATAVSPQLGIALALADFEEASQGADATVHLPSVLIPTWTEHGLRRVGNRLYTEGDHMVIPGPGYPNSPGNWGPLDDPDDPDSGGGASDGEVWVYVTGTVEAPDPHFLPAQPATAPRENRFETYPTVWTIARFDTENVFASLVTIPTS